MIELAVDLVGDYNPACANDRFPHGHEFFPGPYPAAWIVGATQDERPGTVSLKLSPKVLEVNLIAVAGKP